MKIFLALALAAAPLTVVYAAPSDEVVLSNEVLVERVEIDASGKSVVTFTPPSAVFPGDKLKFVLSYKNTGATPATNFTVTNPIPSQVVFVGSEGEGAVVSVDNGQQWGLLQNLKVKQADGALRAAQPSDVTHIRWVFSKAIPVGSTGKVAFGGIVR